MCQSFPATDKSIGKELTRKFKNAGGGVEWKRADLLKDPEDKEPFHLFNKVCAGVFLQSSGPPLSPLPPFPFFFAPPVGPCDYTVLG